MVFFDVWDSCGIHLHEAVARNSQEKVHGKVKISILINCIINSNYITKHLSKQKGNSFKKHHKMSLELKLITFS